MGKKSPPPRAPDLTPITNAQLQIARETNEVAREFLGMSREQFAWMQENAQEELALARQQADRLFEYQNRVFESDEEAKQRFPGGWKALKPYLRLVADPKGPKQAAE